VVTADGVGVANVAVLWSHVGGAGDKSVVSDQNGFAETTWRLDTITGEQHAVAAVEGLPSVSFTATAAAGPPWSAHIVERLSMLRAGESRAFTASVSDRFGNPLAPSTLTWSTTASTVATIDKLGTLTAHARGQVGIIATAGPNADTAYAKVDETAWVSIATARDHTCGLDTEGLMWCWGHNDAGQLGDGSATDRLTPVQPAGGRHYRAISLAWFATCAIADDGALFCWGDHVFGERTVVAPHFDVPTQLASTERFTRVSIEILHGCALSESGEAYCWGRRSYGRLGDGIIDEDSYSTTPVKVSGSHSFHDIAAGTLTCALGTDEQNYCWGEIDAYSTFIPSVPSIVYSVPHFAQMDMNVMHACGIDATGQGYCWGNGATGRIGDGTTENRVNPTPVGAHPYAGIRTGEQYSCGWSRAGALECWGFLPPGGNATIALTPTVLATPEPVEQLSANTWHMCMISRQGNAYCRGRNYYGELGDGTLEVHDSFVRVKDPR
jgi:alpha-tubulin suppressor-like RCC1 family protein